jgi:tricorn protease
VVDFEGIETRVEPFPVPAGSSTTLRAADGAVLWLEEPRNGELGEAAAEGDPRQRPRLWKYDLRTRTLVTLVEKLDAFAVSGDGTRLAYRDGRALTVRALADKTGDDAVSVDLERIRVVVDPAAQWRQMYDENWRLMRDNYWRADMGGTDWAEVGARYRPLLNRIGSTDDLHDVLWEVGAELGTSHAYVFPAPADRDESLIQGQLGTDFEPDADGGWRIARILPGENSVARGRSPLQALGVDARAGDAIVAVDGRPVDPVRGPNAGLVGKAGKPVELTLRREGAEYRRVVVVPLADEAVLRYQDLIRSRRAQVHALSDGRLGYVHVPDMMSLGWAEYHRDLRRELARDGLVVDFRANNGGHTSELVLEKLTRKVIAWWTYLEVDAHSYPSDSPRGALVALADECSGSDGDIVTQAFRRHGLGPVVGTRTWGGVVGIDGKYRLVDGTSTTQPKLAFWFDDAGWGVENHGVDPDVEVPITPQDWAAGRDPQLLEAVRLALESLTRTPALRPPALPGGSRRPRTQSPSTQIGSDD